jgi:hypothetical protein
MQVRRVREGTTYVPSSKNTLDAEAPKHRANVVQERVAVLLLLFG